MGDICGDEAGSPSAEQLREEITRALDEHMVGHAVRVRVRQVRPHASAHPLERLELQNAETGGRIALAPGRLGRRLHIRLLEGDTAEAVADDDCSGRLVAVTTRAGRICLHLQSRLIGPSVNRLPLRRRALQRALPQLAADEVLSCLEGAWEAPLAREILVCADEDAISDGAWPSMTWWPSMPADWLLVGA